MADDLAAYVDKMITDIIGPKKVRGAGYVTRPVRHSDVIEYIEDDVTGRHCLTNNSADHYLLRYFDKVRRTLPDLHVGDERGEYLRYDASGGVMHFACDSCSGEIEWRKLHVE